MRNLVAHNGACAKMAAMLQDGGGRDGGDDCPDEMSVVSLIYIGGASSSWGPRLISVTSLL